MKIPMKYREHRPAPGTGKDVSEDVIGAQLRSFYSTIENQQLPDQFVKLLEKLDSKPSLTNE